MGLWCGTLTRGLTSDRGLTPPAICWLPFGANGDDVYIFGNQRPNGLRANSRGCKPPGLNGLIESQSPKGVKGYICI